MLCTNHKQIALIYNRTSALYFVWLYRETIFFFPLVFSTIHGLAFIELTLVETDIKNIL